MMRLSSRPCGPTVLTFLMLLQMAFKISLQEGVESNGGDPRRETTIQELEVKIEELQTQVTNLEETVYNIAKVLLHPGGTVAKDKIFQIRKGRRTFKGGESECEDKLALPENAEENKALQDILNLPGQQAILGVTYNTDKGMFVDRNGHPVNFFNWDREDTNILENKVCVIIDRDGKWHIEDCEGEWTVVCEFDI